ncbi:MAG: Mov34/MPN/PAD-1 family protein [Candidatus Promineifilaceae bacterium]|nr:Mov34/MPN/PAD-1 family protein [Candidatus Promineifilaceae bacterium]
MTETDTISYTAIISVLLPGQPEPATLTICLAPPDQIPTQSGGLKPLRDCSLGDLLAFAGTLADAAPLPAETLAAFDAATVQELATDDTVALDIHLSPQTEAAHLTAEQVLDQFVVALPEEDDRAPEPNVGTATEATVVDERGEGSSKAVADEPASTTQAEAPAAEARPPTEAVPVETLVVEGPALAHAPPALADTAAMAEPVEEVRILGLRRPLGHATPAAADILINEHPFREAQEHALSSMHREVAGMLIGPRPEKQPDGRYVVHVTDIIIARHTRMAGASVTYTPESWRYVTDVLQERYPDEEAVIVGWYHTHPGFGIFLSGMDLFIHQNFFTQPWHIALVLDPHARRSGFFCWNREQQAVQPYEFPWPAWAAGTW